MSCQGLFDFIAQSPTAFHAADTISRALDEKGFVRLEESHAWEITPGGKYYTTRNLSTVIAFTVPKCGFAPMMITASHADSPTFKIKENAELETSGKYVRLDVERYGGMIMSTWYDRPLSVAGRVLVRTDTGVESRLCRVDRDLVMIPNVAIHMNREINNGYKYNMAMDLMPLFGSIDAKGRFKALIAEQVGADQADLVGADLYLDNRMPGTVWGADGEYISCGQLDDLECAYTSLQAFMSAAEGNHINVLCVFDNEEVGSTTKQGANSTILTDVTKRVFSALGATESDYISALASSFMVSADNAHATHPNHPEFSDPVNQVFMNEGIVIKFNASQRYTTDAVSEAVLHHILDGAKVPYQHYANRSDIAGGGTLGNISGTHLSVNTVDVGLAQLAMHSCYETAGAKDVDFMIDGLRAFYQTDARCERDGSYVLTPCV